MSDQLNAHQDMVRRELEEIAPGLAGLVEGNIIAAPPGSSGRSGLADPAILAYVIHAPENGSTEGEPGTVSPCDINIYVVNQTESGTPVTMDIISGHSAIIDTGNRNVIVPLDEQISTKLFVVNVYQTTPTTRLANSPSAVNPVSQYRCPICFSDAKEVGSLRALPCGHICCGSCLERALATRRACPMCGAPGEFSMSMPLFF